MNERAPLHDTVMKVAVVALLAAALVWSALFIDLLRKHGEAQATPPAAPATGQVAGPDASGQAPAPAPVTTRTS